MKDLISYILSKDPDLQLMIFCMIAIIVFAIIFREKKSK